MAPRFYSRSQTAGHRRSLALSTSNVCKVLHRLEPKPSSIGSDVAKKVTAKGITLFYRSNLTACTQAADETARAIDGE
ncbi:MAG TPA: hypothetical protein DDW52_02750 [Planctomycetaceae bacterium]|nr:hypothetical protein [Planctomycetaceae bacterium]